MAPRLIDIATQLGTGSFDLIVIGAGINGAGIARDAAMRGLRVLLLDKEDIGGGTTATSSRLIHGGLRYLEHREVGLVRESLRERERLLHIAPHLVKPLPLLIPIYDGDHRGPRLIRLGMIAYDVLSYDKSLPRHHMLSREQALERAPGLEPDGLRGAAVYYDAQVEYPERLALENALDARDCGAVVITHAKVDRLLFAEHRREVRGVSFTELFDGASHEAMAKVVVNVAGPWVDQVLTGAPDMPRQIGGTKGSHIVVDPFPGAPTDALYVEAKRDGRPFFIIPWNDLYLIGTTDSRYDGDLDHVEAGDDEIDYLLEETNRVIPGATLTRGSVWYTFSGVRPLLYREGAEEGAITRRHIIRDHAPRIDGLISIVGGKLTTYRNLAEQAVDAVYAKLGRAAPPCRTGTVPLPGARLEGGEAAVNMAAFVTRFTTGARTLGCTSQTIDHLLRVYGARASAVVGLGVTQSDLLDVVSLATGAIAAEVVHAVRTELAEDLTDILLRRTMAGLASDRGIGADRLMAAVAVRHLGWTSARADAEVAAYRDHMNRSIPVPLVR
jgi:glycerol-3-phosphate dehydrogenase